MYSNIPVGTMITRYNSTVLRRSVIDSSQFIFVRYYKTFIINVGTKQTRLPIRSLVK